MKSAIAMESGTSLSSWITCLFLSIAIGCATPTCFASTATGDESKVGQSDKTAKDAQQGATSDVSAIPCISWTDPAVQPRIALLCIHGLGLYSGAYKAFGTCLAKQGIATYAIDVRGFGSWMKAKGHTKVDFKDCVDDAKSALEAIRQAHPGAPVFLMGESMGGAIALRVASMYPDLVEGLISSVPAGERFRQKKTDLKIALEYLKGRNKPFDIGSEIVAQATQNEQLRQDWSTDPLDRMDLSPEELIQFQSFMNENHEAAKSIADDPVLFVQGTKDKLVKPEGTWELFNQLTTPDKYFFAVPSEHLIFEEGQDKASDLVRLAAMAAHWMYMVAAQNGTIVHNPKNNSIPADTDTGKPLDPRISIALSKLANEENEQALSLLAEAAKASPDDPVAHYWLAVTYARSGKQAESRLQLNEALQAVRAAAQRSEHLQVPGLTPALQAAKSSANNFHTLAELGHGKPAIIAFSASWCEQCKPIDGFLKHAGNMLGDSVTLLKVDVDDPVNSEITKQFKIGPIPTFVYLDKDGKVKSTVIGATDFTRFARDIIAIVR